MASQQPDHRTGSIAIEHVGGIDQSEVELEPGVTVLSGRNATNRSSFLQAVSAVLGSDRASLKADADSGRVEFELGDDRYTRTLTRNGGSVSFGGDPYLDDSTLADLFAFLPEDNEARRAVERDDDLREIIMRPIDTDQIERDIRSAEERKRDIDEELQRLEKLTDELPALKSKRTSLETELEETRAELDRAESDLEAVDIDPAESKDRKAELESVFSALRETRSEIDDLEYQLETEQQTIEELESELETLTQEREDSDVSERDVDDLEGRLTELRARKRSLDETVSELQRVIGFNEEMLDGESVVSERLLADGTNANGDAVTDTLVEDEEIPCWTCGSTVEHERISETLDRLRTLRSAQLSERDEVTAEIEEIQSTLERYREAKAERRRNEQRQSRIEAELEESRNRIEELEREREELEAKASELEAETETFEETDYSEALDLHREVNRLELEIEQLESDLRDVNETIEEYEDAIDDRSELEEQRVSIQDELTELRTRVDQIEADAIDEFNEHMASILDVLEYENVERIWIERAEESVRDGRTTVSQSRFELHIVRSAEGTAYRDSVAHLSESEREVTGLVFALAGYLVHDVHEELPIMLLDSLESIDAGRIATLVDYFGDYVEYLVVALLPEDAQALDDDYAYIEDL